MKRLVLLTAAIVISCSVFGGVKKEKSESSSNTSIEGKVIDKSTGEALTGVVVKLEGTNQEVYTDLDGNFVITGLQPGEYNISANMISYENESVDVNLETKNNVSVYLESVEDKE